MTVTSCPAPRAASSTRNGKRPLPAIRPRRMTIAASLVGEHFFGAPRGAAQDDAALRGADEVDEVLHFGAGERAILLDLLQRAASCSASTAAGSGTTRFSLSMTSGANAAAHQADGVDAEDARRPAADRPRERQRVLRHDRVAADERVAADAAELVHAGAGADVREVLDRARGRRASPCCRRSCRCRRGSRARRARRP